MIEDDGWVRGTGCFIVGGAGGAVRGEVGEDKIGVARFEVSRAEVADMGSFPLASLTTEEGPDDPEACPDGPGGPDA